MAGFLKKLFGQSAAPQAATPSDQGMPKSLEEGMEWQAADFIGAFTSPRSPIDAGKLDYSEASLALVDRVLDDFYRQQAPFPDDLHFLASA